IPRIMGVVLIAYSLLTQYEWGLLKVLPMPYHLVIDFAASLFLAISPWLFGFSHEMLNAWLPHVVLGVAVIGLVLVSKPEPDNQAPRIGKTNAILPLAPHGQRGAYRLFPSSLQPKILLVY